MKPKPRKTPWREIALRLAREPEAPPPRDADAFWREFHQRLPMVPQMPPRTAAVRMPWFWVLGGAGAAAVLVSAALFLLRPTPAVAATQVLSYHVDVPHSCVLLWRDEQRGATILWVSENED